MLIKSGNPVLHLRENRKIYTLTTDWEYLDLVEYGGSLLIEKGFKTDLATVPSMFFWWQYGHWNVAAIAHDHIVDHGFIYLLTEDEELIELLLTKKENDLLFYRICLELGTNKAVAFLMFLAVRIYSMLGL